MIYLASPYSHPDPAVVEQRFQQVCLASSVLMARGLFVFSPIAHTHPIAMAGKLPTGWDYWQRYDRRMIEACEQFYVLTIDGWQESKGVQAEIGIARELERTVYALTPDFEVLPL
jgi:hypothetical protein